MREGRGPLKDCERCPDRALCDIVDSADIQFWPEEHRLEEVSRRFGKAVSQTEYERIRECLFTRTWLPGETTVCGSNPQGGMNQMIRVFPPVLQAKLGDDGARALIELLEKAATARDAEDSLTQDGDRRQVQSAADEAREMSEAKGVDIQRLIDHSLTLFEDRMRGFILMVTLLSTLFLTLFMLVLQLGQAVIGGT